MPVPPVFPIIILPADQDKFLFKVIPSFHDKKKVSFINGSDGSGQLVYVEVRDSSKNLICYARENFTGADGKKWQYWKHGSYNTVYSCLSDRNLIFKKIINSAKLTDSPERSVRVWNEIYANDPTFCVAQLYEGGWTMPRVICIDGDKTPSHDQIRRALLDIFKKTKRIVVDASASGNFLLDNKGIVRCADVGWALRLTQPGDPDESVTSLDEFDDEMIAQYKPFFNNSFCRPISPLIKALLAIAVFNFELTHSCLDLLLTDNDLVLAFAGLFDSQGTRLIFNLQSSLSEVVNVQISEKIEKINENIKKFQQLSDLNTGSILAHQKVDFLLLRLTPLFVFQVDRLINESLFLKSQLGLDDAEYKAMLHFLFVEICREKNRVDAACWYAADCRVDSRKPKPNRCSAPKERFMLVKTMCGDEAVKLSDAVSSVLRLTDVAVHGWLGFINNFDSSDGKRLDAKTLYLAIQAMMSALPDSVVDVRPDLGRSEARAPLFYFRHRTPCCGNSAPISPASIVSSVLTARDGSPIPQGAAAAAASAGPAGSSTTSDDAHDTPLPAVLGN